MSTLTLLGEPLLSATVRLPRRGGWVADVEHAYSPIAEAGDEVSLVLGSQTFTGTVHRVYLKKGRSPDCRIVGGAGKLGTLLTPQQYRSPTARNLLEEACSEAGETLSSTSDLSTLAGVRINTFERSQRTLGQLLDTIAGVSGLDWRVLSDGSIFVGASTWAEATLAEYTVQEQDAELGRLVIGSLDPTVLPGQTLEGVMASLVVHVVDADGWRTEVYQDDGIDRTVGLLDALIQRGQPVDLFAAYQYQVLGQNADGTLELRTTDARLSDLSSVPIRFGTPGTTADITSGVVLVQFAGGNEQDPYVSVWLSGDPTNLRIKVGTLMELGSSPAASFVALSSLVDSRLAALSTAFTNWVPVPADGGSALKVLLTALQGTGWPATVAATKVKAT